MKCRMYGSVLFFYDRFAIQRWHQARPASPGEVTKIITRYTRFPSAASLDTLRQHDSVPNVRRVCLFAAARFAGSFVFADA